MRFVFRYHCNDYRDDRRKICFQLGGGERAASIVQELDFVDVVEVIDEGIILSIAIQQIPEVVSALAQNNVAIYSIVPLDPYVMLFKKFARLSL